MSSSETADTILIVDDEEPVRKTFRDWLGEANLGCQLLTAADAHSALALADKHTIDLAVLDWNLGAGNDGLQLLEDLTLFNPDVVAIMVTGFANQATPLQAMRMGVRDYLDKNQELNAKTLVFAVQRQLARIRPAKNARRITQGLAAFRGAVEQVLPLVQSAAALNDPVPLTNAVRSLFRFLLTATGARDGVLLARTYDPDRQPAEVLCRAYDDGRAIQQPLAPFSTSLACGVISMQEPQAIESLDAMSGIELQPFERGRRNVLAAPLDVAPGTQVVLELFDKHDREGRPAAFDEADRRLARAAGEFAAELLRQGLAERHTSRLLSDAVAVALRAGDEAEASVNPVPPPEPDDETPADVLAQLQTSLAQSRAAAMDAASTLRLAEAIRVLALAYGPRAVDHCTRLVEDLRALLDEVAGEGAAVSEPPADVFDQLFGLLRPERFLRDVRASGEGVRVCVVDSGVDRSRLEEKYRQAGQHLSPIEGAVFREDRPEPLPDDGRASSPHGTTVADIILTLAPRVQLYSADVFGPLGACEVRVVIRAIRHAMDVWGCKVINLSLGITEQRLGQVQRRLELQRTIEEAYYRDVLVIAAAHNDHPITRSYPAAFAPPLISVDKGLFADPLQFAYQLREQVEFQAHGRGYLGPFAAEPATSWAAPHLSGIAARILSLRPELKPFEMKTILYWLFRSGQQGAGV